MRKDPLVNGEVYHIFNKSIAGFNIFNNGKEFLRIVNLIVFYQCNQRIKPAIKFSRFVKSMDKDSYILNESVKYLVKDKLVEIIAYCIMPTHIHIILQQLQQNGITIFMSNILNGYTRYFNIKHKRKGPLWEGRFKSVLVGDDIQLLHLTRYIHLNPVTPFLVDKPEDWAFSSYKEFLSREDIKTKISKYDAVLEIEPEFYKNFVENRTSYQRELAKIKELIIEESTCPTSDLFHLVGGQRSA